MEKNTRLYPLILFDGVCNLCNAFVIFLIQRDPYKRFKFASLQSPAGQEFLQKYNLPVQEFDTFVLVEADGYSTKSTAALKIAKQLPGWWPLLTVFLLIPRGVRDIVYDLIAKNRYRLFGKKEACLIPTPDIQDRFVE